MTKLRGSILLCATICSVIVLALFAGVFTYGSPSAPCLFSHGEIPPTNGLLLAHGEIPPINGLLLAHGEIPPTTIIAFAA